MSRSATLWKEPLKNASTTASLSESRPRTGKSSMPSRIGISKAFFTGPDISSTSASTSAPSWTRTWLGTVEVPDRFTVMEIQMDTMLGVWRDELDVEHPQVLRLNRTGN